VGRARRDILCSLDSSIRKPIAAFALATVIVACGQIAGLHDPDGVGLSADGGGDGGGIIEDPAGADDVAVEPSAIDIGPVACGAASADVKDIVIRNRGATTPKYTVQARGQRLRASRSSRGRARERRVREHRRRREAERRGGDHR
jgi:hypothetical protein